MESEEKIRQKKSRKWSRLQTKCKILIRSTASCKHAKIESYTFSEIQDK